MTIVTVKNKELDVSKINRWIVEDEHDSEEIQFIISDGADVSEYVFYLLYRNSEKKGGAEVLTKSVDGDTVYLTWIPSHDFTYLLGTTEIQIVGFEFANNEGSYTISKRWSTLSSRITLPENIEVDEIAPGTEPSVIEDAITRLEQKLNELISSAETELQYYVDECNEIKRDIEETVVGLVQDVEVSTGDVSIKPFNTAYLRKGLDNEYSVLELGTNIQLNFIVNGVETTEATFVTGVTVTKK